MKIKALAFDMDGTLLNKKHEISNENLKAIKKAKEQGMEIILASGRAPMRMEKFAKQLGVRYIVCFNGSIVKDLQKHEILKQDKLTGNQARAVYDFAKDQRSGTIIYIDGKPHTRRKGIFSKIIGESQGMKINSIPRERIIHADKIVLGSLRKKKVLRILDSAKFLFKELEVFMPNSRSVEFCPKGVNKAAGLDIIAKKLQLKPSEFMCFGDGGNDVEMFKWSGHGIAMGNAMPELVGYAKKQVEDNNSDAIAKVINGLLKK